MAPTANEIIRAYNAGREPERLALKMAAMRGTVFSFHRGSAHLFWQRVHELNVARVAPIAWCSGDLNLENFGTYRGDNGLTYFDINDFDEAALAPCDWEILRLLASILIASPALGISKTAATAHASAALDAYQQALASGKIRWIERKTATGAIGALMTDLKKRSLARMLARRTVLQKGRRMLAHDPERSLPVPAKTRAGIERLMQSFGKAAGQPKFYRLLDAARRVSGNGSLGLLRFVLLIDGDSAPDTNVLLDLKAAPPSTLAVFSPAPQPPWPDEAHRIVTMQQHCQAIAPARLSAVTFERQPFVLKELQPSADRLDLAQIAKDGAAMRDAVASMGRLAAWAQLRSAGRSGSANADALMAFAAAGNGWAARLLAQASDLAATTRDDYKDFCQSP